ncbi:magnesium chelatase domain-containing protein, partial [Burkholderia vietnamiensis]|uniref:magnesium chelatase domain-containing protein n=1 Tax=Burkholderia vietnamiensis TaxID=60552 RepID=UPI0023EEFF90
MALARAGSTGERSGEVCTACCSLSYAVRRVLLALDLRCSSLFAVLRSSLFVALRCPSLFAVLRSSQFIVFSAPRRHARPDSPIFEGRRPRTPVAVRFIHRSLAMSLAVVRSRAPAAGRAPDVTVEVHLANGLPSFSIVGLPDVEVRESRERVRAALQNCGFDFPVRRITVNLAPADLPKESGRFDLPIALGILAATGQIPVDALAGREFAGELSLTGALRPMRGAFAMACGTARDGRADATRDGFG